MDAVDQRGGRRRTARRSLAALALLLCLAVGSVPAWAADTVEAWEAGATDVEFYLA